MEDIKRIVVAMDFGECSARALELAERVAKKLGAKLTLVHVQHVPPHGLLEGAGDEQAQRANTKLDGVVRKARKRGFDVDSELRIGNVLHELIAAAEQRKADLLVMGTHGRGNAAEHGLGSVAEKVVRLSPIPVLTVRLPRANG